MADIKKNIVKILAGLLVFIIVFIVLSPLYVYRSVCLKLKYSTQTRAELSVATMRYPADVFTSQQRIQENFILDAAEKPHTVYLELPVDNRFGGFRLFLPKTVRTLKIYETTILYYGKEYPVRLQDSVISYKNQKSVIKTADCLLVRPGKNIMIYFARKNYMSTSRRYDFIMAFYAALIALLPALLVFVKFDIIYTHKNAVQLTYVTVALLMLIFPVLLIDYYGHISDENRFMNLFPDLLVHRRFNTAFFRQFEDWFSDRFSGRRAAIKNEKSIFSPTFAGFSHRQSEKGFVGKENWMFGKNWYCIEMFQNKNRFTENQLETCAANITALNDYFQKHNVKLYIMLTPDKERVYPEFYPQYYKQVHPESRLEQLYKYLTAYTKVKIIFPYYELQKVKKQYPVFYKTGSHWTYRGAYIGYQMLFQELKKDFPDLPADQPNAEKWEMKLGADTDIASLIDYTEPYKQLPAADLTYDVPRIQCRYDVQHVRSFDAMNMHLKRSSAVNPRKNGLKIFACTDSFWVYLMPFMFPVSNQMFHVFFDGGSMFELHLYRSFIEEFKPDAVIIESTERFLDRFLTISIEGE